MSNIKYLQIAVLTYHDDYDTYPQHLSQITSYTGGEERLFSLLDCLSHEGEVITTIDEIDSKTSYLYRQATDYEDTLPILSDKPGNHNWENVNMGFVTGKVENCELTHETIDLINQAFGTSYSLEDRK